MLRRSKKNSKKIQTIVATSVARIVDLIRTNLRRCSIAALIIAGLAPDAAVAQFACGPRGGIVETLAEKYGESRRGGGFSGSAALFEVWASAATGSWTILKITPNGLACILAFGEGWQADPPPPPGRPL